LAVFAVIFASRTDMWPLTVYSFFTALRALSFIHIYTNTHTFPLPQLVQAVTWSWASVNGPVTFPDTGYYLNSPGPESLDSVTFHDCQIILRGSNPYGEIECAWLELEAPLTPLSKATDNHKRNSRSADWHEYFSIVDGVSEELLSAVFDVKDEPVINLFALFMMHAEETEGDYHHRQRSDEVKLSGLILRPVVGQERIRDNYKVPKGLGLYQRVGLFYLETRQEEVLEMAPVTKMVLL
jgi:hypothetical protein